MKFGVKHLLAAIAGLAMAGLASAASATPVTYDLTLVPVYGPGGSGSFTIDDSGSFLGHYTVSNGGLLALEFNIDGHTFDLSTALSTPDPEVDLLAGFPVNILYASGNLFFNFGSGLLLYTYNNVFGQTYSGGVILASRNSNDVPEPLTLALVGAGLAGMGAMRKRKAA
jgi:hypothetical protein